MKLAKEHMMYFRSMGKAFRITAIFTDMDQANDYMEKNRDEGLIAEVAPYLFLANLYDHGTRMGDEK